jgi:thimet oligopeptidase
VLHDYTATTPESVAQAVEDAIGRGEVIVDTVVGAAGPRTWANTMDPLNRLGDILTRAAGIGPFMTRAHPERAVRDAAQAAEERLSKWINDLNFRRELYEAVEEYAATDEAAALEGEHARFLDFTRRDFRRAGHELSEGDRRELQDLRTRLVELEVAFNRNIDEYQDGLDLTPEQLAGLPDSVIARLADGETAGTKRVSLDYPDYYPFMDEAEDRDLRRRLQFKFYNKAVDSNRPILEEAIAIRHRIAEIFGMTSWAHFAMEVKMAKEPKAVEEM